MKHHSKGRLFIVGCPRSGTTLLQCLLAAHSQVFSLPETAFFADLSAGQRRRRMLGIASPIQQSRYRKFLSLIDVPASVHPPRHPIFIRQYTLAFVRILDALAYQQGKSVWLEKTPFHVRRIPLIERYVPGAKFIHMIRNGPDNIASLYDVSNNHTAAWKFAWNVDECIKHWVIDVRASLQYAHKSNHFMVGYQQIAEDTHTTLKRICQFIDIPFEEAILKKYTSVVERVATSEERWKAGVAQAISNRNGTKFYEIFTQEQQQYILQRVAEVDLTPLGIL